MLISAAYAQAAATATNAAADASGYAGSTSEEVVLNIMLVVILVGMFYLLMIVPQQKRFRKHKEMLDALKKGDPVVTAGGLIGKVDKLLEGVDEVVIDLGGGVKVTAVRSTVQARLQSDKDAKKDVK